MKGVNKVILVGTLGKDPETRYFPNGDAVTNATMATSESWKDKQTGQKQERTEWHRLSFFDRGNYKLGQIAGEYLKKGSKVYIEGKLQTRKYQKDGSDRFVTEIVVSDLQMLDKAEGSGQAQAAPQQRTAPAGATPGQRKGPDPSQAPAAQQAAPTFDPSMFDDDIPFF